VLDRAISNLFIGVPGIGKTMTAELLAKLVKTELMKIGASELDYSDVAETSRNLQRYFELAARWKLILLMCVQFREIFWTEPTDSHSDEADVFLNERLDREASANAMVSGSYAPQCLGLLS
jgi:SpoVK/Ycf46/Vps4 family AAA+-type ATPase